MRKAAIFNLIFILYFVLAGCGGGEQLLEFSSRWSDGLARIWLGEDFWANRLQDWRISNGRLECLVSSYDRYVSLLTRTLGDRPGDLSMSIHLGRYSSEQEFNPNAWAGFRIGAKGQFDEYRDTAILGKGLEAGITIEGGLFIGKSLTETQIVADSALKEQLEKEIEIQIKLNPQGELYGLELSAYHPQSGKLLGQVKKSNLPAAYFSGGLGLVAHFPRPIKEKYVLDSTPSFWFSHWTISGTKIDRFPERAFGPILFAQYTLSDQVLKLTAQMPPLGKEDTHTVGLQIKKKANKWTSIAKEIIQENSFTATFRIPHWDNTHDIPYRLVYKLRETKDLVRECMWQGIIRKEPLEKEEVVVAAFTGNNDLGFPNTDISKSVEAHDPDLLFFSGDQIYEGVGGRGVQRKPDEKAAIGYLGKWYQWGWAYKNLIRNRPTICIPDDHDVYHGNLWGAGGKACSLKGTESDKQDTGGYKMPPWWVNMVQKTQTSHLPDPIDPTPILQGIEVYYTSLNYAGISFAIIDDRKFKSAPKSMLPEAEIWNGWPQNCDFDAEKEADVPEAVLLGKRQLDFLEQWAADWSKGIWMKVLLSQTIFANVATLPKDVFDDKIVPSLRILPKEEYAENDRIVTDLDSNGWPQSGRNRAIRVMRKGFALHIAGDQHLGSTICYGVDEWNDSGFAICVPSISNVWPRRWYPPLPGKNREPGAPPYSGEFEDGFGNKITVHAVSNPTFTGKKPTELYDRATGFGLIRYNRVTRDITIECWPRLGDPNVDDNKQYPGWPVKINQLDNYGRKAVAYLPTYKISGLVDPVFQIIAEKTGETVYTLRIKGSTFTPWVFTVGTYTVKVGEPGSRRMKVFHEVTPIAEKGGKVIEVGFISPF